MRYRIVAPNGRTIVGSSETILGTAWLECTGPKMTDGSIPFDHTGGTEVHWDSQETQVEPSAPKSANRFLVDDNGILHVEKDCTVEEVPD